MKYRFKKLTPKQYDRLSEIIGNLSLVFFAGLVIPIFNDIDEINWFAVILGIAGTLISTLVSLLLSKK